MGPDLVQRVFELSQRTNQLNISARRYAIEEIETLMTSVWAKHAYVLSCKDRFGDYGIIGFCVMNRASALVECFFLSCRVQRKRVEDAFLAMLPPKPSLWTCRLRIAYRQTDRNQAAVEMLRELGFEYFPRDAHGEFRRAAGLAFEHGGIVELSVADDKIVSLRASA